MHIQIDKRGLGPKAFSSGREIVHVKHVSAFALSCLWHPLQDASSLPKLRNTFHIELF